LERGTAHASDSTEHIERAVATILERTENLNFGIVKSSGVNADLAAQVIPLLTTKILACFGIAVHLDLLCTLDRRAGIATNGSCDSLQSLALEGNVRKNLLDNLANVAVRIGLEIDVSQAVLERAKELVSFSSRKHESLLLEVELVQPVAPAYLFNVRPLSIESSEEYGHQVLGERMALVQQHGDLVTLDDRGEYLFKEHLSILDGAAIDFEESLGRAVLGLDSASSLLGELGLAHTLGTCQQQEGKTLGLLMSVEIEVELLLDILLTNQFSKTIHGNVGLEFGDLELHLGGEVGVIDLGDRTRDRLDSKPHLLEPDARHRDRALGANELIEVSEADIDKGGGPSRASPSALNNRSSGGLIHTRTLYHIFRPRQAPSALFFEKKRGPEAAIFN